MGENKNKDLFGGSFVKMAAILAAAGLIVRFIGFLYRLPLTNMIGDEGNGIYAAGYNIYNFFLIMSSAGLPVAISKMVSKRIAFEEYKNVKKVFTTSMIATGVLSFICAILMVLIANGISFMWHSKWSFLEDSYKYKFWYDSIWCLYTLAPTIFIVSIMAVFRGFFQGFNTTVPTALSQLIEQIFNAIFSVYLAYVLVKFGVEFGAAGGTAGTGIGAVSGLIVLFIFYIKSRKSRKEIFSLDKGNYKIESRKSIVIELFKIAIPIITGTAIFSMTNFVDMVMVNSRLAAAGFNSEAIQSLYGQLNGKYVTLTTMPVLFQQLLPTAVIPSITVSMAKKDMAVVKSKVDHSAKSYYVNFYSSGSWAWRFRKPNFKNVIS